MSYLYICKAVNIFILIYELGIYTTWTWYILQVELVTKNQKAALLDP